MKMGGSDSGPSKWMKRTSGRSPRRCTPPAVVGRNGLCVQLQSDARVGVAQQFLRGFYVYPEETQVSRQ